MFFIGGEAAGTAVSWESENYLGVRKRFTSGRSVSWIGIGEDFEDFDGDVVISRGCSRG